MHILEKLNHCIMSNRISFFSVLVLSFLWSCQSNSDTTESENADEAAEVTNTESINVPEYVELMDTFEVPHIETTPLINGIGEDECWKLTSWRPINQVWVGEPMEEGDFEGHYKVLWDHDLIYVLVKVLDDTVMDIHEDPLQDWWKDDCVEVFIDEDNSDGEHQFNNNAFAYHIALNGDVVDLGTDKKPHLYNDHVSSKHTFDGKYHIWEMAFIIHSDQFDHNKETNNSSVHLMEGKEMGFAIAYCDNDHSEDRENFIGSIFIPGEDKDQGWKDAGVFNTIRLK